MLNRKGQGETDGHWLICALSRKKCNVFPDCVLPGTLNKMLIQTKMFYGTKLLQA